LFLSSWQYDPKNIHPGSGARIRILIFYQPRISDPGVKKAPDPGSANLPIFKILKTLCFLQEEMPRKSFYLRLRVRPANKGEQGTYEHAHIVGHYRWAHTHAHVARPFKWDPAADLLATT
jgi:hypothetical protein